MGHSRHGKNPNSGTCLVDRRVPVPVGCESGVFFAEANFFFENMESSFEKSSSEMSKVNRNLK